MAQKEERSIRIAAAANRVLSLTERIDGALDDANRLADERAAVVAELGDLVSVRLGSQLSGTVDLSRLLEQLAVLLVLTAGPTGITGDDLRRAIRKRLGTEVSDLQLEQALGGIVSMNDIALERDRYFVTTMLPPRQAIMAAELPVKAMILDVLKLSLRPLGVAEIRASIDSRFGRTVKRTTISPALGELRRLGEVVHEGHRWSIAA